MSLTHECWETVIIKCENENWEVARCIIRVSKKENRFSFLLLSLSLIQDNPKTTTNKQKQNNNTVCTSFINKAYLLVLVEDITHHYAQQLSTRLGRSRYKEQFLFLYRDDVVDLIDCYQYKDDQVDDVDAFKRELYILYFKTYNTGQSLPLLKLIVPGSVRTRKCNDPGRLQGRWLVSLIQGKGGDPHSQ
uniref:Uncharacterized protein n=1 Tax=Pundamilia nyererei TaxID=303518 RepID=A0A3B4F2T6_9CICH